MDTFDRALTEALDRWRLPLTSAQLTKLRGHFEAVIEANRTMNLTRITEPVEAAIKHYADSLAVLVWANQQQIEVQSVLDIGTGAGYPAVPLAVMQPRWNVTAIDATAKKVRFVQKIADELGLSNLRVEHAHSRHWKPAHPFDMVVLRAIARLSECVDQAARHVAPNGWIVIYKTAALKPGEAETAVHAAEKQRLTSMQTYAYNLQLRNKLLHRVLYLYRRAG